MYSTKWNGILIKKIIPIVILIGIYHAIVIINNIAHTATFHTAHKH